VFSLGATLVYAATGHPPYQGETVMDILVRLATEPPDLDGLPDELSALVSACLQRVPRDRPTDSAILGGFGSFTLSAGAGHVPLPDSAMAVIAEYLVVAEFQHHPRLAEGFAAEGALDGDPGDRDSAGSGTDASGAPVITDVTDGSHTPLPGFESPAALPQAGQLTPAAGPAARSERAVDEETVTPPAQAPQKTRHRSPRRRGLLTRVWPAERALLPLWARALIAVLLVASGTAIGMVARGAAAPAAKGDSTSGNTVAARNTALGPVMAPPHSCTQRSPGTTPEICLNLPSGDGDTGFIIHGSGFQTFTQVTVTLTGVGTSPDRPMTDLQGTFSYVIDQGHRFFQSQIPAGLYHVVATESGGHSATATFRVNPPGPPPPPPGQP
jgi:hypothetical protein